VLEQNENIGDSHFDSLNLRLQKRISSGLSVTANYLYSRLIEQITWLNDTDAAPGQSGRRRLAFEWHLHVPDRRAHHVGEWQFQHPGRLRLFRRCAKSE
jgi:hypothetical protein